MNAEQIKQFEDHVKDAKENLGWDEFTFNIDSLLTLLADYHGAQFAAASHLRTVEQQAKIIAGMDAQTQAATPSAYMVTMEDDRMLGMYVEQRDAYSTAKCYGNATKIAPLYRTPSAAMQGQGLLAGWKLVPVEPTDEMAVAAIKVALFNPAINGVETYRAMLAAAPTPPAAKPQAGGRELTDAGWQPIETVPQDLAQRLYLVSGFCVQGFVDATGALMAQTDIPPHWRPMRGKPTHWMPRPAPPKTITTHITGTKGATE